MPTCEHAAIYIYIYDICWLTYEFTKLYINIYKYIQYLEVELDLHVFSKARRIIVTNCFSVTKGFQNGIALQQAVSDAPRSINIGRIVSEEM